MRNPKRIDEFVKELGKMWKRVPDWRFGQLMCNFLGEVATQTDRDVFFHEDDEMLEYVKEYMTPAGMEKANANYVRNAYDYYVDSKDGIGEEGFRALMDMYITPDDIRKYVGESEAEYMEEVLANGE